MEVTIIINRVCLQNRTCRYFPPNLNARMHWRVRSDWTKAFKEQVWGALQEKRNGIWEMLKARIGNPVVSIIFYSCHLMDYDNSYGSAKPLIDALKGQVIDDDRPDKLTLYVTQKKVAHLKDQKTEIIIS